MIVLDENFPESQRQLLRGWRIIARQIGYEVGRKGMQDDEIVPYLLRLRHATFFTLDSDFYVRELCHARYCLVYVNAGQYESASFIRRLLRHPDFSTKVKRMGSVIRVMHTGLAVWRLHAEDERHVDWQD